MSRPRLDCHRREPVLAAGASAVSAQRMALFAGAGPEGEIEQEADRDHHGDHADHIPGPTSNDQRVRYVRWFS